jgi:inactivated superfamily I helicase
VQVAIVWENRYLLRRVRYSTLRERLNSNSGIKLSAWRAAALPRRVRCYRRNRIWNLVTKAA